MNPIRFKNLVYHYKFMKKVSLVLIISLFLLSLSSLVSAAEISLQSACQTGNCPSENEYCVYYFYGDGCPHCAITSPIVDSLLEKYQNFTLHKLEIYHNSGNQDLYQDFVKRYSISRAGVPAVFIGSDALLGSDQIKESLESKIQFYLANKPECPLSYSKKEANPSDLSPNKKIDITLGAIIAAALIDSINPCAFAVLIFLLVYLANLGATKRTLKIGLVYIITVFIVYFLAGIGLLTAIQSLGFTKPIFYIAAFVSIAAGLINVKDFFWYGKGITLAIPESKKATIERYIQKASMPAAIILGLLVALFELPCTGGVYLAILSLIAKNAYSSAVPYLLFYNLIFVFPLLIILLTVYFGFSARKAEEIRVKERKWLRLVMGLAMIILGLAMLLGWFG